MAIGLIFLAGCKKLIAINEPINTLTTTEVFSSEAQAESSLAGLYAYLITPGGEYFGNGGMTLYAGLSSDELSSFSGSAFPMNYEFESNQLVSTNTTVDGIFWEPLYKEVYYANAVLDGVANAPSSALSDSARNQLNGEAKFVRAFCYFYLTNLFGDVPMPLSIDFNKTELLARTPQAQVYDQIVQDLKDAQSLLPGDYAVANGEHIRPNKWAATALLARAYLYVSDWTDAAQQASSVIASGQYSLLPNLAQVFLKNSTESIWQLQPSSSVYPYGGYDPNNFNAQFSWAATVPAAFSSIYLVPATFDQYAALFLPTFYLSPSASAAFEQGDQRRALWTGYTPTPAAAPWTGDTILWSTKYTTAANQGGITQYYMVLRLAEQYLIRAEAEAEGNNLSAAAADINIIRNRAGLSNTTATSQSDLLAAVAQERRVELFAEWGHRWFDLKRTGNANATLDTLSYKQPWKSTQLLYPIPVSELTTDPHLIQNSGY